MNSLDEKPDTKDVDTEKGRVMHALCATCYPQFEMRTGDDAVGICGTPFIFGTYGPNPEKCVVCSELFGKGVQRCGHS